MPTYNDIYSKLISHPKWVLFVIFALAVLLGSKIPEIQLDASGDSLVLEGDKSLEVYRRVYKEYGATDFLFVTYKPNDDLYSRTTMENVASLKKDLEKLQTKDRIFSSKLKESKRRELYAGWQLAVKKAKS